MDPSSVATTELVGGGKDCDLISGHVVKACCKPSGPDGLRAWLGTSSTRRLWLSQRITPGLPAMDAIRCAINESSSSQFQEELKGFGSGTQAQAGSAYRRVAHSRRASLLASSHRGPIGAAALGHP